MNELLNPGASCGKIRLKLALAYNGTAYSGWQIQEKPNPPPTIQGELEKAFFVLTGRQSRAMGSGRTDAGVHAFGQIAHVDIPFCQRNLRRDWRCSLNALLPRDIRILNVEIAPATFHARDDAVAKTYIYQLWQEPKFIPPHLNDFVWSCGPLKTDRILAALHDFSGEHDFASFQNAGTKVLSSIRAITAINIQEMPPIDYMPSHLPLLRLSITATGFLKQMARNIVGFLVYVGKGKLDAASIKTIFERRDRRALPAPTAPAKGLSLARVFYLE